MADNAAAARELTAADDAALDNDDVLNSDAPQPERTGSDATGDDLEPKGVPRQRFTSQTRLALMLGVVMVVAVASLAGWLGYRGYQSRQVAATRGRRR
jgi:Mce-associated membrane protein